MRELEGLTGLAARTIRKYMQLGLLPKSTYRGTRTSYDREQLFRLLAIKRLTLEKHPVAQIKATLRKMSPGEIEEYAGVTLDDESDAQTAAAPPPLAPPLPPAPALPPPAPPPVSGSAPVVQTSAPLPPLSPAAEQPVATLVSDRWTRTVLLPGMELLVRDDAREIVRAIAEEIRAKYGMS